MTFVFARISANAAFPDDLDVSFYHGEMSDVSFSLNVTANDHVVPDASSVKLSTFYQGKTAKGSFKKYGSFACFGLFLV